MRTFSAEDIAAITAWYETNKDRLPTNVQIAPGETVTNVPKFLKHLLSIAQANYSNPTFSREIQYLFDLKDLIENTKP